MSLQNIIPPDILEIMAGRTLAEIEEEYSAVRTAYLKALQSRRVNVDGIAIERDQTESLRQQMLSLDAEIKRLSRGGIRIRGGTPV